MNKYVITLGAAVFFLFMMGLVSAESQYSNFSSGTLDTNKFNFVRSTSCDAGEAWTVSGGRANASCQNTLGNWKLAFQVKNVVNWSIYSLNFSVTWSQGTDSNRYFRVGNALLADNAGDQSAIIWQNDYFTTQAATGTNIIISWEPNSTSIAIRNNSILIKTLRFNSTAIPTIAVTGGSAETTYLAINNVNTTPTVLVPVITANTTTYETARETLITYWNSSGPATLASAALIYNDTSYSATVTNNAGFNYSISSTIDIPIGPGTKSWFHRLTYSNGTTEDLYTNYQDVALLNFSLCGGAPQNVPYINFTFKNETAAQQTVSGAITSSWSYYLGSGGINKSLTYNNAVDTLAYAFCATPGNRTLTAIPTVQYSNSYSTTRNYYPGTLTLTNTTLNKILYLLPTSAGSYVTFVVVNDALQAIEGVRVNATRSGVGVVETAVTDSSGAVTLFLDPTVTYTITAFKTGYPLFTSSITPSSTQYTINLASGAVASSIVDSSQQVFTSVSPQVDYLLNGTFYVFNFTINSSYYSLQNFGFNLFNSTGGFIGSNMSTSSNFGTVSLNLSSGNNASILMNYFWRINGTNFNQTKSWLVFDSSGSEHSINAWSNRLKTYLTQGMFGMTPFALNIIVFVIIFVTTGIVSYKFGLTSPFMVSALLVGLIVLFDGVLGLVSYPDSFIGSTHPAIWMSALICLGLLIKEVNT